MTEPHVCHGLKPLTQRTLVPAFVTPVFVEARSGFVPIDVWEDEGQVTAGSRREAGRKVHKNQGASSAEYRKRE